MANRLSAVPRVTLATWAAANVPPNEMLWKGAAAKQIAGFEALALATGSTPFVISTHRSKSIVLPVVLFDFGGGLAFAVVRNNFHDHKVTVLADDPVLFEGAAPGKGKPVDAVYCEGFPETLVLGTYAQDPCAFTIAVGTLDDVAGILGTLARHVGSGVRGMVAASAQVAT